MDGHVDRIEKMDAYRILGGNILNNFLLED